MQDDIVRWGVSGVTWNIIKFAEESIVFAVAEMNIDTPDEEYIAMCGIWRGYMENNKNCWRIYIFVVAEMNIDTPDQDESVMCGIRNALHGNIIKFSGESIVFAVAEMNIDTPDGVVCVLEWGWTDWLIDMLLVRRSGLVEVFHHYSYQHF